jgi:hypothetical protein
MILIALYCNQPNQPFVFEDVLFKYLIIFWFLYAAGFVAVAPAAAAAAYNNNIDSLSTVFVPAGYLHLVVVL